MSTRARATPGDHISASAHRYAPPDLNLLSQPAPERHGCGMELATFARNTLDMALPSAGHGMSARYEH